MRAGVAGKQGRVPADLVPSPDEQLDASRRQVLEDRLESEANALVHGRALLVGEGFERHLLLEVLVDLEADWDCQLFVE